ncbi:hypothetical protein D3C76_1722230 [compost metagenome]
MNLPKIIELEDSAVWLKQKIQSFYSEEIFLKNTTPGVRAIPRFKELSLFGTEYFRP